MIARAIITIPQSGNERFIMTTNNNKTEKTISVSAAGKSAKKQTAAVEAILTKAEVAASQPIAPVSTSEQSILTKTPTELTYTGKAAYEKLLQLTGWVDTQITDEFARRSWGSDNYFIYYLPEESDYDITEVATEVEGVVTKTTDRVLSSRFTLTPKLTRKGLIEAQCKLPDMVKEYGIATLTNLTHEQFTDIAIVEKLIEHVISGKRLSELNSTIAQFSRDNMKTAESRLDNQLLHSITGKLWKVQQELEGHKGSSTREKVSKPAKTGRSQDLNTLQEWYRLSTAEMRVRIKKLAGNDQYQKQNEPDNDLRLKFKLAIEAEADRQAKLGIHDEKAYAALESGLTTKKYYYGLEGLLDLKIEIAKSYSTDAIPLTSKDFDRDSIMDTLDRIKVPQYKSQQSSQI